MIRLEYNRLFDALPLAEKEREVFAMLHFLRIRLDNVLSTKLESVNVEDEARQVHCDAIAAELLRDVNIDEL